MLTVCFSLSFLMGRQHYRKYSVSTGSVLCLYQNYNQKIFHITFIVITKSQLRLIIYSNISVHGYIIIGYTIVYTVYQIMVGKFGKNM